MDPGSWKQAKDVIFDALARPESEREMFVRQRCDDAAVCAEILAMLRDCPSAEELIASLPSDEELDQLDDLADLGPGTHVGQYVIIDRLGRGGMGQVFLCRDLELHRRVALKCLLARRSESGTDRARILREARAAAAINHASVAAIYHVIEQDDRAFIVMEYVEGESLSARLKRERLPIDRAVAIGCQLAAALIEAHARGVIHRDLKPGNIQITPDGSVKVLDFGVARLISSLPPLSSRASTTGRSGLHMPLPAGGTPPYMAPEQLLGRALDERSDIYSLGVVLFEIVTGRRPYDTLDPSGLVEAHAKGAPRADSVDRTVPRPIADVIAKALATDPLARYQSAREAKAALEAVNPANRVTRPDRRDVLLGSSLRAAVGVLTVMGLFVALGFMTCKAYDVTLSRTGPFSAFASEAASDYLRWGLRSMVAPTLYVIGIGIAVSTCRFAVRLVKRSTLVGSVLTRLESRMAKVGSHLGLDDPETLVQSLTAGAVTTMVIVFWWFWDLNRAWAASQVNVSPAGWLYPLDPHNPNRGLYRITLTILIVAFTAGLWRVIKLQRLRHHRGIGRLALATMIGLMVVMADLPYRLFNYSEGERVDYDGMRCYDIGEAGDEILIYCPRREPPRNQIVKRADPALRRLGIVESVFSLEPSSRAGR